MNRAVLVVDVGTSKVHITLVDTGDGSIIDTASQPYQWIHQKEGWSQISADEIWNAAEKTVALIVGRNLKTCEIAALSFSYMGDTLLAVDEAGKPLMDVILCFDTRSKAQAEKMRAEFGAERFSEITSGVLGETVCPPKMLWIKEELPEIFAKTAKFLSIQQYFNSKLGLGTATDYTLACRKCMFDVREKRWSEDLCRYVGVTPEMLGGPVVPSDTVIGEISHFGSVALPAPAKVIVGAHDSECGLLGVGCLPEDGSILGDVAGTYDHLGLFTDRYGASIKLFGGRTCSGPFDNSYICMGGSVAGPSIDWVVNAFYPNAGKDILTQLFEQAVFDGTQNVMLTRSVETGDGSFRGVHLNARGLDFFEAAVEGVTVPLIDIVDEHIAIRGKGFACARIGGGGARSDKWVQLKANVFNLPVERVQSNEISALGAALMAAHALGLYATRKEACERLIRIRDVFEPQPELVSIYRARYERMKECLR